MVKRRFQFFFVFFLVRTISNNGAQDILKIFRFFENFDFLTIFDHFDRPCLKMADAIYSIYTSIDRSLHVESIAHLFEIIRRIFLVEIEKIPFSTCVRMVDHRNFGHKTKYIYNLYITRKLGC